MKLKTPELMTILSVLEEIVPVVDKIGSGFKSQEATAFALLFFFREKHVLDKLSFIRKSRSHSLSTVLSEGEYYSWVEEDIELWVPPYNKSPREILAKLNSFDNLLFNN